MVSRNPQNRLRENSVESQWSGEHKVQILSQKGGPKNKRKQVRREEIVTGSSKSDIRPNSGKKIWRKSGWEIRPWDVKT